MSNRVGLSGTALKILACLCMMIDHMGVLLFPHAHWMRVVGRLAFPLFAFLIAEGCRYTRHRLRYWLQVTLLGIVCEAVYMLAGNPYYGNVLLTFSLSIALTVLWQHCQETALVNKRTAALWFAVFLAAATGIGYLVERVGIDYGLAGVMTPVFVAFGHHRNRSVSGWAYGTVARMTWFCVALIWLVCTNEWPERQLWSLLAVPLVLLYNGKAGRYRLKYAFYLFYPLHLLVLQGLAMLR